MCDSKEGSCVIVKTERDERKVEMRMLFCTVGYILSLVILVCAELVIGQVKNLRNKDEVRHAIRTAVMSKQYGNEDFLANLITNACGELPVSFVCLFGGGGGVTYVCLCATVCMCCIFVGEKRKRTDRLKHQMS